MDSVTLTKTTQTLGAALIEALGLPQNVTRLVLTLDGEKPPVVECEYVPTEAEGKPVGLVKGCFQLVEIVD